MAAKIKIMYFIGSMETGGTERHILEVVRNIDRSRFEPILCCISSGGALEPEYRATGIKIGVFGFEGIKKKFTFFKVVVSIFWFVLKERPHIVHAYLYWANILGGVCGWLTRRPVIITSRRGMGTFMNSHPWLQPMENYVNRITDIVTVNSLGVERDVIHREEIDRRKIRLIYNGVSDRFGGNHAVEETRAALGLKPDDLVIGCVANVRWYKGYGDLIEAFASVHTTFQRTKLVCVGKDSGIMEELKSRADSLGCGNDVIFLGPRNDVEHILPIFHIQVLASHEEGFSNAILEGMAAGNPMVVTDVGGNAEAVVNGVTGYVVPPKDPARLAQALHQLLDDPEAAARMGQAGQQRVRKQFTISTMVNELEGLYLEQLKRKRPRMKLPPARA